MGQFSFLDYEENFSLEDQLKTLREEELLDFWEDSHSFSKILDEDKTTSTNHYEKLILQELTIRTCLKLLIK